MNVDELERRFIRAAQHELAPSAADRERNQAAVLERLAAEPWGGSAGTGLGIPSHSARSVAPGVLAAVIGSMRGSRLGMLGVGLIVGAVVGGWFGFGLGRKLGPGELGRGEPPAAVANAVAVPPEAPLAPPSDAPAPSPETPPASLPENDGQPPTALASQAQAAADADAARRRGLAAGRARAARSSPPVQLESSLAAELAMLQRARRALNADNGRLALGIVQELDERFPKGVLVEERNATRILSLCQLERVAEAKQAARDFLGRYPSSVYAGRVRQSCAAALPD
jgi:hypothetical protein